MIQRSFFLQFFRGKPDTTLAKLAIMGGVGKVFKRLRKHWRLEQKSVISVINLKQTLLLLRHAGSRTSEKNHCICQRRSWKTGTGAPHYRLSGTTEHHSAELYESLTTGNSALHKSSSPSLLGQGTGQSLGGWADRLTDRCEVRTLVGLTGASWEARCNSSHRSADHFIRIVLQTTDVGISEDSILKSTQEERIIQLVMISQCIVEILQIFFSLFC